MNESAALAGAARVSSASITSTDIQPAPAPAQVFPIEICKFWKNRKRNEHVRVVLDEYEGHRIVNIRVWFTGDDGIDRPSTKGIALGIAKLPELAGAIAQAHRRALELGLIGGNQ